MPIEFKEYLNAKAVSFHPSCKNHELQFSESYKNLNPVSKNALLVDIEALHVGPTRNYTWYTEQAIKSSLPTWTAPYERPLIMFHNEDDGVTIGRVFNASEKLKDTRSETPALLLSVNVPDKEGKEEILDGRLKTVSVGVIAKDVRCSICGAQLELDENGYPTCGHIKGHMYDGEMCYWQIYEMEAKELSYVIVPSDPYAHNVKIYNSDGKDIALTESLDSNLNLNLKEGANNMSDPVKMKQEGIKPTDTKTTTSKDPAAASENTSEELKPDEPTSAKSKTEPTTADDVEIMKKQIETLEKENKQLKEEKATVEQSLKETETLLDTVKQSLKTTQASLAQETTLRESAENSALELKKMIKEPKAKELNSLRQKIGLEALSEEVLSKRTLDSINDSINDLKESLEIQKPSEPKSVKAPNVEDPTLKESHTDDANKNFKESINSDKNASNINFEENFNQILNLIK